MGSRRKIPKSLTALIIVFLFALGGGWAWAETKLSLPEVIRLSEQNSEVMKSARHDSSSAVLNHKAAKALRFPALSLSATSYHINKLQSIDVPPMSMEIGTKDNYQADFKLSLPLFTGGRISSQVGAERENALAMSQNVQAQKLKNAYLTRQAYLELMIAEAMLKSAQASLSRIEIIRRDAQNLYAGGMADSVDILDAELAFQQTSQAVDQGSTVKRNASALLVRLIGVDSDENLVLTESIPTPVLEDPESPISGVGEIDRPELRMLDYQIKTAEHLVGLERAAGLPSLSGYTGYSVGKPNRDQFNKTWNDNVTVGLSLIWEFNLGGRSLRKTQAAGQAVWSAKEAKRDAEETLELQAGISREKLKHAYQAYVASGEEYRIAQRKFHLAREKQKAGQISVNRLLEQEAELTATEQLHQASMIDYYLKEADYLYAIGSSKIYGGL
jgi:outer membrane protein